MRVGNGKRGDLRPLFLGFCPVLLQSFRLFFFTLLAATVLSIFQFPRPPLGDPFYGLQLIEAHLFIPSVYFAQFQSLHLTLNIPFLCLPLQFFLQIPDNIDCPQILISFDDDELVLLVEHAYGFFCVSPEEVVDGLNGVLHLDDLVLPEMDEIGVVCRADLQFIPVYLALNLLAEVLEDPSYVG